MAAAQLKKQLPLPAAPQPLAQDTEAFEHHELVHIVRLLSEIGENDLTRSFLFRLNDLLRTTGQRVLLANLATSLGRDEIAVSVAKRLEREGIWLIPAGYPLLSQVAADQPERALVLGVIRQESAFHEGAVSSVGARGLMQLMPDTALKVARDQGVAFKQKDALTAALTADPSLNIKLGSAYLQGLLNNFNGSYVLAVASYNAGPNRAKQWMQSLGDPHSVDPVDWIESIPFTETRGYVQRVLEGTQIYRRLLGQTASSLDHDLTR